MWHIGEMGKVLATNRTKTPQITENSAKVWLTKRKTVTLCPK